MRDSTIFKLAITAGVLAFAYQLVTVTNEDLNVEPASSGWQRGVGPHADARRAAREGDFIEAARILTADHAMSSNRLDQRAWSDIGEYLQAAGPPKEVIPRWRELAPTDFVEMGAAEGWAAYFTGYEWLQAENVEYANEAWAIGEKAFEEFLTNHADVATEWDWLYLARTRMRMEKFEAGQRAMEDVQPFIDEAVEPEAIDRGSYSFTQTAGRTWAEVGRPDMTRAVWRKVTEARLVNGQSYRGIAINWLEVANALSRGAGKDALRVALDETVYALEQAEGDMDGRGRSSVAGLWSNVGWRYKQIGEDELAAAAHERSIIEARRVADLDPNEDSMLQWAESALAVGNIDEAIQVLERGVEEGWFERQFLADSRMFEGIRDDPRFYALIEPVLDEPASQRPD
jgi:tetratricopeptide (TPR) repeat protein